MQAGGLRRGRKGEFHASEEKNANPPCEISGGAATGHFHRRQAGSDDLELKVAEQLKLSADLGC